MLNITTPALTDPEWTGVRQALDAVADCGCGDAPAPGSIRDRIGRAFHALSGHDHRPALLSPEQRVLRDFLCETSRAGRIAEAHIPALNALGYSRPQIEVLALVGA